jgi:hypothetical protein
VYLECRGRRCESSSSSSEVKGGAEDVRPFSSFHTLRDSFGVPVPSATVSYAYYVHLPATWISLAALQSRGVLVPT